MAFISLYLFCFLVIVNFYLSYVIIIYVQCLGFQCCCFVHQTRQSP